MISSVSIGNFKAFADKQTLPIKPITLIFGANSSGKSSIIHSVLLANEIMTEEKLNMDVHFTKLGGESVDLGGFRQFVNRRIPGKNVLIGIELKIEKLSDRLREIFYDFNKINLIVEFGTRKDDFFKTNELGVLNYEIITDDLPFLKMSRKEAGLVMDFIENENIVIKNLLEVIVTSFTTSENINENDKLSFTEGLNKAIPELRAGTDKIIPSELLDLSKFNDPRKSSITPVNKENRNEILQDITKNLIPFIVNDILSELSICVNSEFKKIEYLGPLRSFPERHFNFRKSNDNNWKAGGGYAWEVVSNNKEVREKVNEWLGAEKLKQKYELRVIELIPDYLIQNLLPNELSELSHDAILQFVLNTYNNQESADMVFSEIIDDFDPQTDNDKTSLFELPIGTDISELGQSEIINQIVSKWINFDYKAKEIIQNIILKRQETLNDLILYDKSTNTQISHRDVGVGISQVLPVLVSAFANKEKLITIEQPEIHLHPALQAELGDLFINSALGESKNSFILETHSEHLILRIMRRIRETTEGTLPEGFIPVKPEDVQIVFVKPSDKGAEIINLEIDEEGDFKTKWPDGFFEERAEELF